MQDLEITNIGTWYCDNKDEHFRFKEKTSTEDVWTYALIETVIEIPNDVLIEFYDLQHKRYDYRRLEDIYLIREDKEED